ncbi:hypothetical protein [Psychrobacillus antarcticus]|uniref:hypothetical protein n=1 Tax=Psychrobacillus antarcticus TaxID=2879115 RepID=UPI002407B9A1|nr:hypothetical protein [Psychrobacillus antarcticus]
MNNKKIFGVGIVFILFLSILFPIKSLADWAYAFVVWDDYVYVVTDEQVDEVEKEIGHVTKYSDREGTYSGNFSNAYPKGTKYYSIQGISTDEAIATQEDDGTYIKAKRDGEYASNKYGINNVITLAFIGAIFLVIISIVRTNYYGNRSEG